ITGILSRNKRTYSDLAAASGISKSALSQLTTGAACSPRNLSRLVKHIADNSEDRSILIKAHLLDELARAQISPTLIHILTPGEKTTDDLRGQVSGQVYEWLSTLGLSTASGHTEFERITEALAALAKRFTAREASRSHSTEDPIDPI